MADLSVAFCHRALVLVHVDVKKHIPGVRLRDAWVYKVGKDHWEFHYTDTNGAIAKPNGVTVAGTPTFYWHGSADNAYDARAKGWAAYLRKLGVEE